MIFIASDTSSLAESLSHWELAEYVACFLVAIACAGEYVAEFTDWLTDGIHEKKTRLIKLSTVLLVASLAFELICLVKTNSISGLLVGSLSEKAGAADSKAQSALDKSVVAESKANDAGARAEKAEEKSGNALTESTSAEKSLGKAENESNKAQAAASQALTLARDARQEADTFEKDIVSAKNQAAAAESHLAEALRQSAAATAELNRIQSPRSLLNESEIISELASFKGTEYTFSGVCAEEECINLLVELDGILQRAGWKRTKPPGGFPAINVLQDFPVVASLISGIRISVNSTESLATLQAMPTEKLPQPVLTAVTLRNVVSNHLFPAQQELQVHVEAGPIAPIRIDVGKKP